MIMVKSIQESRVIIYPEDINSGRMAYEYFKQRGVNKTPTVQLSAKATYELSALYSRLTGFREQLMVIWDNKRLYTTLHLEHGQVSSMFIQAAALLHSRKLMTLTELKACRKLEVAFRELFAQHVRNNWPIQVKNTYEWANQRSAESVHISAIEKDILAGNMKRWRHLGNVVLRGGGRYTVYWKQCSRGLIGVDELSSFDAAITLALGTRPVDAWVGIPDLRSILE